MADEAMRSGVAEQQEIVKRYALQLQQTACVGASGSAPGKRPRPAEPDLRRCYELLNQCAMELAEITRRRGDTLPASN